MRKVYEKGVCYHMRRVYKKGVWEGSMRRVYATI